MWTSVATKTHAKLFCIVKKFPNCGIRKHFAKKCWKPKEILTEIHKNVDNDNKIVEEIVNNVDHCNTKHNSDYSSSDDNCVAMISDESTDKKNTAEQESHNCDQPGNITSRITYCFFNSHERSSTIDHRLLVGRQNG